MYLTVSFISHNLFIYFLQGGRDEAVTQSSNWDMISTRLDLNYKIKNNKNNPSNSLKYSTFTQVIKHSLIKQN